MAEPRIQYAKTKDGVNIAYSVIGDDPPRVVVSSVWGTLHMRGALTVGNDRSTRSIAGRVAGFADGAVPGTHIGGCRV